MSSQFSENNPRLAGPALKAFSEVAEAWSLTPSEQLSILGLAAGGGHVRLDAVAMGEPSTQAIQRISYVIGIYRALHTIFPIACRQTHGCVKQTLAPSSREKTP